jgi:hypothetical protein
VKAEEARNKQKILDDNAKELEAKAAREKEWADRLVKEKKRREQVERERVVEENLSREKEDKQREEAEKERILKEATIIEERERIEGERCKRERREKEAARDCEERGLAVVAAASQEEKDNMMCSCTLSKFAPHRLPSAGQYFIMGPLHL